MEKFALMGLAASSLKEIKEFYRTNPDGQWPWTAVGEDRAGNLYIFKIAWDPSRSSALFKIAEDLMREQNICRYVLSAEAWAEFPEGRGEGVLIAGADVSGERYGMTFRLARTASGVVLFDEAMMFKDQCEGDVFTLLGDNP